MALPDPSPALCPCFGHSLAALHLFCTLEPCDTQGRTPEHPPLMFFPPTTQPHFQRSQESTVLCPRNPKITPANDLLNHPMPQRCFVNTETRPMQMIHVPLQKCLCSKAAHRLNKTLSLKAEIIPTLLKMTVFPVAMRKILDHYANQLL